MPVHERGVDCEEFETGFFLLYKLPASVVGDELGGGVEFEGGEHIIASVEIVVSVDGEIPSVLLYTRFKSVLVLLVEQWEIIPLITPPSGTPSRGSSARLELVITTFLILPNSFALLRILNVPSKAGGNISSFLIDPAIGLAKWRI